MADSTFPLMIPRDPNRRRDIIIDVLLIALVLLMLAELLGVFS